MLKDLFTDPSWTWLPGPEAQTNLLPIVGGTCVCKSFDGGKLSVHMGICFVWLYVSSCSWMVNQCKSAYCILPSWFVGRCFLKTYPRQQKQFVTYPVAKNYGFQTMQQLRLSVFSVSSRTGRTETLVCYCWGSICWSFSLHLPCSNRSLGSGTSDALGIPTPWWRCIKAVDSNSFETSWSNFSLPTLCLDWEIGSPILYLVYNLVRSKDVILVCLSC